MSGQPSLLAPVGAPTQDLIDLRRCDVAELLPLEGDLCIADPPWSYVQKIGESRATNHYQTIPVSAIVAHLEQAQAPRMAVWLTWPILASDWPAKLPGWGRPVTGGSWSKSFPGDVGHYGQGYHWAGCSEPVLVYSRGGGHNSRGPLRNSWVQEPGTHSVKPVGWMKQWIQRWCPPGGRVVDPYAGLGSVAEAVLEAGEGRSYLGCEIDEKRHGQALALLAQWRAS